MQGQIARGLCYLNRLCQKAAEEQLQGEHTKRCIDVVSGSWHEIL